MVGISFRSILTSSLYFFILICGVPSDGVVTCPDGWTISSNSTCYRILSESKASYTACQFRSKCMDMDARLATLYDNSDVELVQTIFGEFATQYYIGLTDIRTEGEFQWMDGSSKLLNMAVGDTSNPEKHCVVLQAYNLSGVIQLDMFNTFCIWPQKAAVCEKGISQTLGNDDLFTDHTCYVKTTTMATVTESSQGTSSTTSLSIITTTDASTTDELSSTSPSASSTSSVISTADVSSLSVNTSMTTSSFSTTTRTASSVYKKSCRCRCIKNNIYSGILIVTMRENLKVEVKDTNKYKRKFMSISDDRTSSKAMGCMAISIIVGLTSTIVVLDLRGTGSKTSQQIEKMRKASVKHTQGPVDDTTQISTDV